LEIGWVKHLVILKPMLKDCLMEIQKLKETAMDLMMDLLKEKHLD